MRARPADFQFDIFKRFDIIGTGASHKETGFSGPQWTMTGSNGCASIPQEVGATSQREIERIVREGRIEDTKLKLHLTLTAENVPLNCIS
jgi:Family of unknown function (DUF6494)